jgi:putative membrane protein insertion efficiency factor
MNKLTVHALAQRGLILLIQCYQQSLSSFFGPCCRFAPSCSSYASQSIQRFGIVRGSWLSVRRLSKCHPFHPGGCDPVPEVKQNL